MPDWNCQCGMLIRRMSTGISELTFHGCFLMAIILLFGTHDSCCDVVPNRCHACQTETGNVRPMLIRRMSTLRYFRTFGCFGHVLEIILMCGIAWDSWFLFNSVLRVVPDRLHVQLQRQDVKSKQPCHRATAAASKSRQYDDDDDDDGWRWWRWRLWFWWWR
jgi:hypothetical protein